MSNQLDLTTDERWDASTDTYTFKEEDFLQVLYNGCLIATGHKYSIDQIKQMCNEEVMIKRSMILARTASGIVGNKNKLPWCIKEELELFKKISSDYGAMVMGKNTFESLPGVLPNREHIVLTTDKEYSNKNAIIEHNVQNVIDKYSTFIVIGGTSIWEQFLPYIDTVYLSVLHREYKGDIYYKEEFNEFETVHISRHNDFTHYMMKRV